ncbi:uncharacterized protein LOC128718618 [Anopheles marshallii]|uniref:uncharacterized protein LOC128718618 n=1 Tax=Anopheles marshallii TaxID=1521116 RepID=UPI00237AA672|nr:uncharacterized protein LOC128718618 [Anopheles marshallii]
MAKGAKRKTKWVSLSLANANTKTSNATGSDSEQTTHSQQQHYGDGHRSKMYNGASLASKAGRDVTAGTEVTEEHSGNERTQDHSGNRTDTSTGSDCATGQERRSVNSYHRRRPPPYNARTGWSGGSTGGSSNGRNNYHRNGYYGNGGGYYGGGKRSYFDSYTRRQQTATSTNRTTSGDGAETGGTTINDDEYTRITTPRQDVLFKKGYLSRPKPSVATASTSNTGSSSIAGTTSEGSDGGNAGGSNSISTTESITSEYGGSFAADGSPLYDYSIPCIPCGYFTENGVLVMNGFAVDNNGFSYFNGGQTYIYPPNYNGCQQSPLATTNTGDQTADSMLYATDDTNDEANTNESTELDRTTPNHSTPVIDSESMPGYEDISVVSCSGAYNENEATGGDGQYFTNDGLSTMEQVPLCEVVPEQPIPTKLAGEESVDTSAVCDASNESASTSVQEVQDFSENGYFQYTNGFDLAQFYNSLCYPNLLMDQYRLYDDAGLPLYSGSEYAMANEEVYGHQHSFKKRKKRFRTFEEMPSVNGNSFDVGNTPSEMAVEPNTIGSDAIDCVPANHVPSSAVCHQSYQLNAEVQEFLPSVPTVVPHSSAVKPDDVCASLDKTNSCTKGNTCAVAKPRHSVTPKLPKPSSQKLASGPVAHATDDTANVSPPSANGKPPLNKANRKKDLIESTLAFAAQNIDLTRPKTTTSQESSHDSELFWTTVDRNGRKKRVASVPEQHTVTANSAEKESSTEERTKGKLTVGDGMQSEASIQLQDNASAVASQTLLDANAVATDESGKKEQPTKSKKKTHKHKRQQLRRSMGNFNKQPLEGFQLIEPEFTSSATGHRKGKSSDKAGRVDTIVQKAQNEDTQVVKQSNKKQLSATVTLGPIGTTDGHCRVVEEQPETVEMNINCDNSSNGTTSEVSLTEEVDQYEVGETVAQKIVPLLAFASAMDVKTIVNKTETEKHHQQLMSVAVEQEQKAEIAEQAVVQNGVIQNDIKQVVPIEEVLKEANQETVQSTLDPTELDASMVNLCLKADNVSGQDETNETLSPVIEKQQLTNVKLSVDTSVFASAAKQLTISSVSPTLPALEEDESEDHVDGVADDSTASEGDDTRTKRDSMSGAGYTESIDSGLQSPAPCGGVASPETSSMVSSIESQPAIDLPDVASSQSALSQVVGTWLMRKLEVHEPEEVFILPNNPLLIQRLERFHQLQRREHRDRLRGPFSSESEGEDQEYDLEDDDDTDSDYMSDGHGRIDRTQSDDANSTNPGSPLNSVQQDVGVVQKNPLGGAQQGSLTNAAKPQRDESKRYATQHSDGGNSSKRCIIM